MKSIDNVRALHVAALPFPTHQGTQALLRVMLEKWAAAGRQVELLTYHRAGYALQPSFPLHRAPAIGSRSLRSGPSVGKLVADAGFAVALRARCRTFRPDVVVAHHVEAATLVPRAQTLLFFAHTDLGAELPAFLPAFLAGPLRFAGQRLDHYLAGRARAIATVSPWLAERFSSIAAESIPVGYVPPPFAPLGERDEALRARTRQRLGIGGDDPLLLYAGNLDAYQGWTRLPHALSALPSATLVVGTQSDASPLWLEAQTASVAHRVRVVPLDGEEARSALHAAADVAVIVRGVPGGIPIKLLDALARGLPCVVSPTASAGLPLGDAVVACRDESAQALTVALEEVLARPEAERLALSEAGHRYLLREHSDERFFAAFDELLEAALR